MYPESTLINIKKDNLVVFEKDSANPENEGFVCYWEIYDSNVYKLIFKKRLTRRKAISMFRNLIKEGWVNTNKNNKVA